MNPLIFTGLVTILMGPAFQTIAHKDVRDDRTMRVRLKDRPHKDRYGVRVE